MPGNEGAGKPTPVSHEAMTHKQLLALAAERGVKVDSKASKATIAAAINAAAGV